MKPGFQSQDRAAKKRKKTEAKEPRSQGATDAIDATEDKPGLFTLVNTVQEAVALSLKDGFNADSLFLFARALKAFEQTHKHRMQRADRDSAFAAWWRSALPLLPRERAFDEFRLSFLDTMSRVRSPLGSNSLDEAIKRADSTPLPAITQRYGSSPKLQRLVAVCYHLQILAGTNPFFVSARSAARVMGDTCKTQASKLLNGLVCDGVLIIVTKGLPGQKKATRFRFKGDAN
jgi:hypothetical protein